MISYVENFVMIKSRCFKTSRLVFMAGAFCVASVLPAMVAHAASIDITLLNDVIVSGYVNPGTTDAYTGAAEDFTGTVELSGGQLAFIVFEDLNQTPSTGDSFNVLSIDATLNFNSGSIDSGSNLTLAYFDFDGVSFRAIETYTAEIVSGNLEESIDKQVSLDGGETVNGAFSSTLAGDTLFAELETFAAGAGSFFTWNWDEIDNEGFAQIKIFEAGAGGGGVTTIPLPAAVWPGLAVMGLGGLSAFRRRQAA